MENLTAWLTAEFLSGFLLFAAPGFLAVWVFFQLTPHQKADRFDRIVQPLMLAAVLYVAGNYLGTWVPSSVDWTTPYLLAPFVGMLLALASNRDWPHWLLRKIGVTRESAQPSSWVSAFATYDRSYVILHLHDGRRVCGWPKEWPNRLTGDHIHLQRAMWLDQDEEADLTAVPAMLLSTEDVQFVEFLEPSETKGSPNVEGN